METLNACPELAYGATGGQLTCLPEAEGTPGVQLRRSRFLRWNDRMDDPHWVQELVLGKKWVEVAPKPLPLHAQASAGPPP